MAGMDYKFIAAGARRKVLEMVYKAQTSHIGSNLSVIDIFAVLFERVSLDKDKVILSAGWKAAALYYFLWKKGRISLGELNSYCQPESKFIGLSEPIHPDIPFAGGSMGMGLPAGVGFALSKKLRGEEGTVYVIMSDGELQCGTTWEASLIAAHHKLGNLVVIVDNNGLQAMGETEDILSARFPGEGWIERSVNGHSHKEMAKTLSLSEADSYNTNKPSVIIADTIKGKGWKRAEDNNDWHYKNIDEESYKKALAELNG
jgi:transketolase